MEDLQQKTQEISDDAILTLCRYMKNMRQTGTRVKKDYVEKIFQMTDALDMLYNQIETPEYDDYVFDKKKLDLLTVDLLKSILKMYRKCTIGLRTRNLKQCRQRIYNMRIISLRVIDIIKVVDSEPSSS